MVDVVFLGLNDIGERIYQWLVDRDDARVLALLTEANQLSVVVDLEPDLLIAGGFRHIVPKDVIEVPELGAVNIHKAYLPYNRGANPNVWSILEDAPAGVSIHYMTPEVDQGPIIDRRTVPVYSDDNGRTLYDRLERAQFDQFVDVWPDIRDGSPHTISQSPEEGTHHYKREFVDLWEVSRDETVTIGTFIDRLRALTFPPYHNAYFEEDGERYYLELQVTHEDELGESTEATKNVPTYSEDDY